MKSLTNSLRPLCFSFFSALTALLLCQCGTSYDTQSKMIVSVRDQQLLLTRNGVPVKAYKVSTSKFGLGSDSGSNRTPLGKLMVAKKIGDSSPKGMVFKSRRPTGEILKPNAPGRDPIVSRIMWLHGKESQNRNTFRRCIYIHGTPEEWRLGTPASYGCIRMSSSDVVDLYRRIGVGAEVQVIRGGLTTTQEGQRYAGISATAVMQDSEG
jgi:lipoprotein-anchoring transpeptidase ErfK/SrfK